MWILVLRPLIYVEILYIPHLPYSPLLNSELPCHPGLSLIHHFTNDGSVETRDDVLFWVLSTTHPDGTLLLPRLQSIVCEDISGLVPIQNPIMPPKDPEKVNELRIDMVSRIREMLHARAVHGASVTRMISGPPSRARPPTSNEKEADAFLAKALSSCMSEWMWEIDVIYKGL